MKVTKTKELAHAVYEKGIHEIGWMDIPEGATKLTIQGDLDPAHLVDPAVQIFFWAYCSADGGKHRRTLAGISFEGSPTVTRQPNLVVDLAKTFRKEENGELKGYEGNKLLVVIIIPSDGCKLGCSVEVEEDHPSVVQAIREKMVNKGG